MSAPYLFSRAIDPIFAMSIGIAAAGVRINREEKEKGKSAQESIESLKRRWAILTENTSESGVERSRGAKTGLVEVGKKG